MKTHSLKSNRSGFTLLELVVVIIILGILIGMLLPAVGRSHRPARRTQCQNNLKQLALASLNYESAHGYLPAAMGSGLDADNQGSDRLSGFVRLLPFLEQGALWEQISKPLDVDGKSYPAMGPDPLDSDYPPWQVQLNFLTCPSSPQIQTGYGYTNYAFCIGDRARNIHAPTAVRGAFSCQRTTLISEISDGTSNTILFAEMGSGDQRNLKTQYAIKQPAEILDAPSLCLKVVDFREKKSYAPNVPLSSLGRGGCWAEGSAGVGLVNTVLPPGSPSCSIAGEQGADGIYSAGSFHPEIAVVAYADGSTHTILEEVDAGDSSAATLTEAQMAAGGVASPFGVWGALGSANGGEVIDVDF